MTSVTIMKNKDFKGSVGTSMFPSDYYDVTFYLDVEKTRLENPELKKTKIKKVMIMTDSHPDFKNIKNEKIHYRTGLCCSADADGATMGKYSYVSFNPVGDVIILI